MSADAAYEMDGYANLRHPPRLKQKKPISKATTLAFSCVAFFVLIIFLAGHNSIIQMHGAMQSPTLEKPAGWATLHRTTTVQSATVTITGSEITGSALTATTTETSTTAAAAGSGSDQHVAVAAAAAATMAPAGLKVSLTHMLGDLQHSLHALLEAHTGWRPGMKITRAQLAAAAAASMPTEGRDIELSAHKVAQVVGGAKLQQQMQRLQQQGLTAVEDPAAAVSSAEIYAALYGQGAGTVVFEPHDDLHSCPEGSAASRTAQAAVVLLAGGSAAALKRSLDGMMLLYSRAGEDIREAFHLYVGLDSNDADLLQAAATYALESMGAVKLVHHSSTSGQLLSRNKQYDTQQQLRQSSAPAPATITPGGATSAAGVAPGTRPAAATATGKASSVAASALVPFTDTARKLLGTATSEVSGSSSGAKNAASSVGQGTTSTQETPAGEKHNQADKKSAAAATAADARQAPAAMPTAPSFPNSHTSPTSSTSSSGTSSGSGSSPVRPDHIRLMLHMFFDCFKYPAVLLLEDDVKLAPDFFEFYAATQWLLGSDKSLYCLSAWNPVGQQQQHVAPKRLLRTDSHPGRGWLLNRELGLQILANWPKEGVKDWQQYVSSDAVRAGRQCLVPELPRLVPAGEHDTFDYAHIVDPVADSHKMLVPDHAGLPAPLTLLTTSSSKPGKHDTGSFATAAVDASEGIMDMEAYSMDYEHSEAYLLDPEQIGQQQQQQLKGDVTSQLVRADAAGIGGEHQAQGRAGANQPWQQRLGWMEQDLSFLMEDAYQASMQQVLLSARPCDVTAAALLTDPRDACRLVYNSAAYLSTIAHKLRIPVEVQQGVHYCYSLPAKTGAVAHQHCQDYMPQMADHGMIAGYNRHGSRIYLVHIAYNEALQEAVGSSAAAAFAAESNPPQLH